MGILRQIEVENFKSWRGKQVIGPFIGFNCIIGTNGSGKSNVMDAISFAIGEKGTSLRVKRLSDLIHGAHIGQPVSESARVALLYQDDLDKEIVFCRSISVYSSGDSSQYHISGVQVTLSQYTQELARIGIVTKAQNCLVFQGAVQSIALKNPKERTQMFEFMSQSSECRAEYNQKKEALQKAMEDTHFQFNKKKSAAVERKQVSQEKLEVQKYQALVEELHQRRLQLSLAELYHNEKAIETTSKTLSYKQEAASAQNAAVLDWEQNIKTHKKEYGRLVREQQHMEKDIRVQEHILAQSRSQFVKAKVSSSHQLKKIDELRNGIKKRQKLLALKEQEIAEAQQDKVDLEKTWRMYERQFQEQRLSQGMDIELDEEQRERYKDLKELARKQNAVLGQQVEKLHWELKADYEKVAFDERKRKEGEVGIKNNKSQLNDFTHRAEKLEDYTKACKSSLSEFHQQEESLRAELQHGCQRTAQVNVELGEVLEELRNARLDSQESKRQLQRIEMLDKLRRLCPESVYGRLCDLCSPIHKKYQLAVTKVFGHYLRAIVVTTEKVARDCIRFLKEERADPETFLPIDYLDVSPLNEQLREIPGAKMVVDVVTSSAPQLRRVVQFVCGNALVCETIKEARSVAFDRKERLKTVSLDGTLFAKSGVISGGSSDLRTKARCWDEKDVTKLKERKEQLTAELRDLMRLKRKESDLNQIIAQAQGAQTRLKYSKSELDNLWTKNIPKCQGDISRLESELANLDSQIQMQLESVKAKEMVIKDLRNQIEQTEDLVFSDFCADIGVDNIRVYQQEQLKQQEEHDRKRLEFENQCNRLNAKLEYEQDQLEKQKKQLGEKQGTINKEQSIIAEKRKDEEKLLVAVEEGDKKLQEMKNQLLVKTRQVAAIKSELDEKNLHLRESNRGLVKHQQEVMSAESSLEHKRLARHNLLLACKIQGLPITMLSGNLNDISEVQLDTESESTSATMTIFEREAQLVVDYSCLETKTRDVPAEEVDGYLERLRESLYSLEKELHSATTPNLKAVEKMREVKDKLQGLTDAFNACTRIVRKCNQEFEQVKVWRLQLFNQFFNHVSVVIDQIYKRICRNSSAQAILTPDNPEEPYLGGINYSCVAPGKRFMSMENLSGGEKAIAALALVFAIHSFRPAPFLILDEVDAALDNSNIGKVTSFIREETRDNMQLIIISLKAEFFSKADALLGVYSDFDGCMFSRIVTLDLRPYPLLEDDNGTHTDEV
ncbi:structural maintenance of chromosomes protein 1B isoform X2 [Dunckerocampus dactyliophorus]|uniref:structural maintenance of chromosomes protein 1B isoform X2 n=1 Tax=Dunckerocampus dactyliophorus TaxID=161453 RepID=UPI0024056580|nr:structural maintenance of chromosomes protein 1B isoform X2 [Dunckerocampus dactyliophorus]